MNGAWPWFGVAALGAYHGVDPSMGWLFAVALGLQEKRRSKVFSALFPIAAGHLVSVAILVGLVGGLDWVIPSRLLRGAGAAALLGLGFFRFARPRAHPRWVAMRVNAAQLGLWSFLMASAHGAGLMLFPILMDVMPSGRAAAGMSHHAMAMPVAATFFSGSAVVLLHTGTMLAVMGTVAFVVYDQLGLGILRTAWVNLDVIWAGALVAAGILSLLL